MNGDSRLAAAAHEREPGSPETQMDKIPDRSPDDLMGSDVRSTLGCVWAVYHFKHRNTFHR